MAISAGGTHTCAVLDDGSVVCWGYNDNGQIGDGTTSDRHTPTQTASLGTGRTAVAISTGTRATCAVLDDDSVAYWDNNYGRSAMGPPQRGTPHPDCQPRDGEDGLGHLS